MKKIVLLFVLALVASLGFAQDAKATPKEAMKITNLVNGKAYSWTALSGTKHITEVQFLETIGNTEYLQNAKDFAVSNNNASGLSTVLIIGGLAAELVGGGVAVTGAATMQNPLVVVGGVAAIAGLVSAVSGLIIMPSHANFLAADQAQVLADAYNAK